VLLAPLDEHDRPMILSGTITLSPSDHVATTAELRARLEDLDARRRRADRSIEAVLGTWRGGASDSFRARWEEWSSATTRVVEELAAAAQALDLARADAVAADASSEQLTRRLA
jgi:WXG100 family type VII secretion target